MALSSGSPFSSSSGMVFLYQVLTHSWPHAQYFTAGSDPFMAARPRLCGHYADARCQEESGPLKHPQRETRRDSGKGRLESCALYGSRQVGLDIVHHPTIGALESQGTGE